MSNAKKQWDAHVEGALAAKDSIAVVDLDWDAAVLYAHQRIAELEAQLSVLEWISVEDRLPDDNELVLVYTPRDDRGTEFDFIEDGVWSDHEDLYQHFMELGGYRMCGDDVSVTGPSAEAPYTHRMPLPAAPDSATSAGGE